MKTTILSLSAILFTVSNLYSIDTVFVNGTDTNQILPKGFTPIDTSIYTLSKKVKVVYYDTTDVVVRHDRSDGEYRVIAQHDSTMAVYRVYRIGTSNTRDIEISLNLVAIKRFGYNTNPWVSLDNEKSYTDSVLMKTKNSLLMFKANNVAPYRGGVFGVDLEFSYKKSVKDTLVVIRIDKAQSDGFISNESKSRITLYPNPVSNYLNIESEGELFDEKYQIASLSGALVREGVIKDSFINVEGLQKGVYVINLSRYKPIRFIKE